jgi:hypothetical protein
MSRANIGVLKRKDLASRSQGLIVANDTRSGRGAAAALLRAPPLQRKEFANHVSVTSFAPKGS